MNRHSLALAASGLWLASVLTACGGAQDDDLAALPAMAAASVPPLLAADGTPLPPLPEAVPTDPAARTQPGLYALRDQAESLDRAVAWRSLWVTVDGRDAVAVDKALAMALAIKGSLRLADNAPVFVSGDDPGAAAEAVNRLAGDGMTRVFLVAG